MELVIWILFVLISLIFQALKKKNSPANQPDFEVQGEAPPTLQDALREIQEALQQGSQPVETEPSRTVSTSESASPSNTYRSPEIKRTLPKRTDQEFKGLERPRQKEYFAEDEFEKKRQREMDLRRKELQRQRIEKQRIEKQRMERQRALEQVSRKKVDESLVLEVVHDHRNNDVMRFKAILKDRQQLQDAFLFNEILGTPVALRGRKR